MERVNRRQEGPSLPSLRLEEKIWKDRSKGELNPEAFSSYARELAQTVRNEGKGRTNKQSQLRKFYDVIFNLNQKAQMMEGDERYWNAIKVQLHRQIALVHYAKGRDLVSKTFVAMMEELINSVENPDDLQVVVDFMETFMAFYRELRSD